MPTTTISTSTMMMPIRNIGLSNSDSVLAVAVGLLAPGWTVVGWMTWAVVWPVEDGCVTTTVVVSLGLDAVEVDVPDVPAELPPFDGGVTGFSWTTHSCTAMSTLLETDFRPSSKVDFIAIG